jgi:voltage-gated potassium channel
MSIRTVTDPQPGNFISRMQSYARRKKYELLLLSFMLLIFGNTFTEHVPITGIIDIYQNMIVGLLVFYHKKWLRDTVIMLISVSALLTLFASHLTFIDIKSWQGIIYLMFFILVAVEVFKKVLYSKSVSRELLSASLCGFVLLCLIGTFVFYQIDVEFPHSFSNTGKGDDMLTNLNYFSFTTLLTVGYGDILPLSLVAKRAVMLVGITGHFYTVFTTSIIIGKYLSVTYAQRSGQRQSKATGTGKEFARDSQDYM